MVVPLTAAVLLSPRVIPVMKALEDEEEESSPCFFVIVHFTDGTEYCNNRYVYRFRTGPRILVSKYIDRTARKVIAQILLAKYLLKISENECPMTSHQYHRLSKLRPWLMASGNCYFRLPINISRHNPRATDELIDGDLSHFRFPKMLAEPEHKGIPVPV